MNLALKDILHAPARFALTVACVAFLITAASGMVGLYRGIVADALLIVERVGADLWIVQKDKAGPFSERSVIPASLERRVAGLAGVSNARRFVQLSQQFAHEGHPLRAAIVGVDVSADDGDWIALSRGRMIRRGRFEAVADRSVGLSLGDRVTIAGEDYAIVGLAEGMVDLAGDGMMFLAINDVLAIAGHRTAAEIRASGHHAGSAASKGGDPEVAAILATLEPGADAAAVIAAMEAWGDVSVLTRDDQRRLLLDQRLWRLRVQILAFTLVLLAVTTIVVSLIVYTMTMEKLHTIAMLKLMGARRRVIAAMILQQAALIGVMGFAAGLALAAAVFPHFPRRVLIEPMDAAVLFAAVAVLAITAGLVGIRRATRVRAQDVLA
ncbi:FtsX-like permease family protein [Acuticoccus sp. MNP-M23]|uniref:ABC transporter permease n=1 Tax=Acuticoccus sp. MNP-M23 TaxID=3072793 RepID=UPI002814D6BE|nr:ABC transporter permease [Acuticoccus sp. MNP-M23]WMS43887.1 FtsX-like permease family protein [Acuticoccus sp. MNP-M23]